MDRLNNHVLCMLHPSYPKKYGAAVLEARSATVTQFRGVEEADASMIYAGEY